MYRSFSLIAALLAVVLAACSGAAPTPTPNPTSTPAPTPVSEAAAADINVGQPAPDFSLPDAAGGTVALSQYEGPVLLYFHMAGG